MALIRKSNPVGVDVPIDTIQVALFELQASGTWTGYESYHRAYKNETKDGIKPEVFTANNDYKDVFQDDGFTVTSFFLVPDNIPVEDDMHTATISIIFQANLKKLYNDSPHRFDAEMHNEIANILKDLDASFSFIDKHTSLDDVYDGLNIDNVKFDDTHPLHVVRFEVEAKYQEQCDPVFATGGATCTVGVTVQTTDETSIGADDGTASATPSGGQGNLTFAWTGPNSFTSTDQNIINLEPGIYTVIVTDDITAGCTATDNGTVEASTSACTISLIVSVTPETFAGFKDGTASATPSGGQGSLTFAWTGPNGFTSTDQNLTDLFAGIYTCIVTDSIEVGCTATDNGTVANTIAAATSVVVVGDDASTINAGSPSADDPVSTWADRSGNGNDITQPTAIAQPLWKTTFLQGDGNDWMTIGQVISKLNARTIFIVYKADSVATTQFVCGDHDVTGAAQKTSLVCTIRSDSNKHRSIYGDGTNERFIDGSTNVNTNLTLYNERFTSGGGPLTTMQVNGNDETETDISGTATTIGGPKNDFAIFRSGELTSFNLTGQIHFMAVWASELSNTDNTTASDVIKTKYGL